MKTILVIAALVGLAAAGPVRQTARAPKDAATSGTNAAMKASPAPVVVPSVLDPAAVKLVVGPRPPAARLTLGWDFFDPTNGLSGFRLNLGNRSGVYSVTMNVTPALGSNGATHYIGTMTNDITLKPLVLAVAGVYSNGMTTPLSPEIYLNVNTNGDVYNENGTNFFTWLAQTGKKYTISVAPLLTNQWTVYLTLTNSNGLVRVPLPAGNSGRVMIQAQ